METPIKTLASLTVSALLLAHAPCAVAHRVLACEPEWAALAEELGGTMITAYSATTGLQDPHRIEARPSIIARARSADLLVCTGMGVEAGWLPILLREAGNDRIQPGQPGYLEAGDYVEKLDIPKRLDRAEGDVHPEGNHHIQGDPRNILKVADALAGRLAEMDPSHADYFRARHKSFSERWTQAIRRWEQEAAPLKGTAFIEHHRAWPYLSRWLGLREGAALEPKPGVEPTVAHLTSVLAILQREPARMIVRSSYNSPQASEWISKRTNLPVVVLPTTVGGDENARDLFGLFDDIIGRLLAAAK